MGENLGKKQLTFFLRSNFMLRFSVLGYVICPVDAGWFTAHRGKDVTSAIYKHFNRMGWYGEDSDR